MSILRTVVLAGLAVAFAAGFAVRGSIDPVPAVQAQAPGPVYELRTYYAAPGKFTALNTRFRDHTVRLFAKHGVSNITYWTPVPGAAGAGEQLIYVIPHASQAAAKTFWSAFMGDPDWVKAKAASEASGPLTTRVTSVFLTATDYSATR